MEHGTRVPNQDTNLGTTWNIGIPTFLIKKLKILSAGVPILKNRQVIKKKTLRNLGFYFVVGY